MLKTGLVLVGCFVAGVLVLSTPSGTEESAESGSPATPEPENSAALPHDHLAIGALLDDPTRASAEVPSIEGDATVGAEESIEPELQSSGLNVQDLERAVEDSLYGRINPNEFVEFALALASYGVSEDLHGDSTDDRMRYEILGLPEGLSGQLWVFEPRKDMFSSVRMYALDYSLPQAHFLEGAFRGAMYVTIGVWTDLDGRVSSFAVTSQVSASGENARMGNMPLSNGIPESLHYSVKASNLLSPTVFQMGIVNNQPARLDSVPTVLGAPLSMEGLELLSAGLLRYH